MKSHHLALFKELSKACGVSGYTNEVASIFMREAHRLGLQCSKDAIGSVSAALPSKIITSGIKRNIMITAHIDHVGYIVFKKDIKNKELKLAKVGYPCLEGDYTCILKTKEGSIKIIVTDEGEEELYYAKAILNDYSDINKISEGDPVFYDNVIKNKPQGKFTGAFMDNKASILSMIMAMEKITTSNTNYHNLFFVLTSFEETGGYGAITAATKIKPEFTIVMDVFPVENKRELSCGVVINKGPIYNKILIDYTEKKAKENNIQYKIAVPPPDGESGASYIIWQNGGTPVCEIGIPCINIHLPNEIISKKSLLCTSKLITSMCLGTKEITNLISGGL